MTELVGPAGGPGTSDEHPKGATYSLTTWEAGCRCAQCSRAKTLSDGWKIRKAEREERLAPEHGSLSRYTSKKYRCRCDLCTTAMSEYRQKARDKKRIEEGKPPIERGGPKRPPGWCWLDASDYSIVVRCERCDNNYGVWLIEDKEAAQEFQQSHYNLHAGEAPFDWSKYDTERLIKEGGRPQKLEDALCSEPHCPEEVQAKGLCMKHYQQKRRADQQRYTEQRRANKLADILSRSCTRCYGQNGATVLAYKDGLCKGCWMKRPEEAFS